MATDQNIVRIENGMVLSKDLLDDAFLRFLRNELLSVGASVFSQDAAIDVSIPVNATVATNNEIDVGRSGGPFKAVDGAGHIIQLSSADPRLQGIHIPPDAGQLYCVGLEVALLDQDPQANPDLGQIQYRSQLESIGRTDQPDSVTDNGDGTMTFVVDNVTEGGKDHTGRQVRVWLRAKSDGGAVGPLSTNTSVAFEQRTVAFASGSNKITTAGDFGQNAALGTRSTDPADYIIVLVGPTVRNKVTEDLRSTSGCLFLADVTSVATGNPITTIATTDQRLVSFDLADLGNVLRKDGHGSVKVRVHADASDSNEPQIEVYDSSGISKLSVNELGEPSGPGAAWWLQLLFGDGSDGNLVFDGTSTVLGMVPTAGIYTATRDIFALNCTFTGTAQLVLAGNRLYVRGTLDTTGTSLSGFVVSANNYGILLATMNGSNGNTGLTGGAGGTPNPTGILLAGGGGGAGGNNTTGSNGTAEADSLGGRGGDGGGNAWSGGTGGTVTAPAAVLGSPRTYSAPTLGMLVGNSSGAGATTPPKGGGGGGGGGGNSSPNGAGGGGGAGGGICAIAALRLNLAHASDVGAPGGNGGNGGIDGGGGGGGGGGALILVYGTVNAGIVFSGATNCPGGTGGAGNGGGATNGNAGSSGQVYAVSMGF